MSLFSSLIFPYLEKELINLEPQLAELLLKQLKSIANEVVIWAESKLHVDLNSDGVIGEVKNEA